MAQKKDSAKSTENSGKNKGIENLRHFKKGQSGNPGGRPKVPDEIKEMFKAATPDAVRMLIGVVNSDKEKTTDRIKAAEIILDRHLGKAVQAIDMDAEVKGMPIKVVFEGDLEEWAK